VTRFIAEIGSNHNRERERCLALVDAAAAAGCGAVKLQVFRVQDLFAAEALARNPALAARRAWELPLELLEPVRRRCVEHGLELGATPFAAWAVEALVDRVDFFKIASYDLLRHELIGMCAATGRPLVLSTGMATLAEVAVAMSAAGTVDLRLLHCVSGYPTPPEQANLAAIATLRERFGVPVGWSDHTCSERVVARAVTHWHASDVEVHIDLDGGGYEAGRHSWTPDRLRSLIAALRGAPARPGGDGATLDGDGVKRPMPIERPDIPWRADPADGLRPLRALRAELVGA
jgi:sialic acid synthase SpsE